jgi:hypothetical protein
LTYYSDDEEEEEVEDEYEIKEEQEEDTKEPLLREIWTDRGRCYSYNSQIARR